MYPDRLAQLRTGGMEAQGLDRFAVQAGDGPRFVGDPQVDEGDLG